MVSQVYTIKSVDNNVQNGKNKKCCQEIFFQQGKKSFHLEKARIFKKRFSPESVFDICQEKVMCVMGNGKKSFQDDFTSETEQWCCGSVLDPNREVDGLKQSFAEKGSQSSRSW